MRLPTCACLMPRSDPPASRIVVMSARPTRIREIVDVPFPYPRDETLHESPRFGELRSHLRDLVMKEYAAQARQAHSAPV